MGRTAAILVSTGPRPNLHISSTLQSVADTALPRHDIFISYAGPDEAAARRLQEVLTDRGKRVYFHPRSSRAGDQWRRDLPRHIKASSITAVLVSQHYVDAWYQDEEIEVAITEARNDRQVIVPIRLTDVDLPFGLARLQALDGFGAGGLAEAADAILSVLDRPDEDPPFGRLIISDRVPHLSRWFIGRDDLLRKLIQVWQEGGTRVLTQLINGMGGVGKSSVAAALTERIKADADLTWWLRSEEEATLIEDLCDLAGEIGIAEGADPRERARQTVRHLQSSDKRWLLVFDDVKDEQMVSPWVPRSGRGFSLITTRDRTMNQLGAAMPVDVLPNDVATGFLLARVAESDAARDGAGAARVAQLLGGLPLALEQAGAWVAASSLNTFDAYTRMFVDATKNPFPDGTVPLDYHLTAWASVQVSINAAAAITPVAERLWHVLGWLAPAGLSLRWLSDVAHDTYLATDVSELRAAAVALERFSLLRATSDGILEVHRVVQAAARRASPSEAGLAAVAALRMASPGAGSNPSTWDLNQRLLPHAISAMATGAGLPDAAGDVWLIHNSCASSLLASGDPIAATRLLETGSRYAEAEFGKQDARTLASLSDLAVAYRHAGRPKAAAELGAQVVSASASLLGDDHWETLERRSALAIALRDQGLIAEALQSNGEVVSNMTRIVRDLRHDLLAMKARHAVLLYESGDADEAIRTAEWVVGQRKAVSGEDDPDTLTAAANLGLLYHHVGRVEESIELSQETLERRRRVLGSAHPDTLASQTNLAAAYGGSSRFDQAISQTEQVIAVQAKVLGIEHPHSLMSSANLAVYYQESGRYEEALELGEEVLRLRKENLGPTHPDTLTSQANVAHTLFKIGDVSQSIRILSATIDETSQLPYRHPELEKWTAALDELTHGPGGRGS